MRDLCEMAYEALSSDKDKQSELFTEMLIEELSKMKSADIAPHLTCTLDLIQQKYEVVMSFPVVFNEAYSRGKKNIKQSEQAAEGGE